jgi:hypothetical protein
LQAAEQGNEPRQNINRVMGKEEGYVCVEVLARQDVNTSRCNLAINTSCNTDVTSHDDDAAALLLLLSLSLMLSIVLCHPPPNFRLASKNTSHQHDLLERVGAGKKMQNKNNYNIFMMPSSFAEINPPMDINNDDENEKTSHYCIS